MLREKKKKKCEVESAVLYKMKMKSEPIYLYPLFPACYFYAGWKLQAMSCTESEPLIMTIDLTVYIIQLNDFFFPL